MITLALKKTKHSADVQASGQYDRNNDPTHDRSPSAGIAVLIVLLGVDVFPQQTAFDLHESERSDKLTGGRIERAEFRTNEPDISNISDKTLKQMLAKVKRRTQFVVETSSIEEGRALEDDRVLPLIPRRSKW